MHPGATSRCPSPLRWACAALLGAWLTMAAATHGTHAQPRFERDQAHAGLRGPFDLARWVDRHGDEAVLGWIAGGDGGMQLLAVRGAPYLEEPELALEPLAELAAGSDPWLAPAAARACWRIARDLNVDELERRERDASILEGARGFLRELAEDERARGDLRGLARRVQSRLEALTVRGAQRGRGTAGG